HRRGVQGLRSDDPEPAIRTCGLRPDPRPEGRESGAQRGAGAGRGHADGRAAEEALRRSGRLGLAGQGLGRHRRGLGQESRRVSLERVVTAQAQIYPRVLAELKAGQKQSHWMWFIFPQIAGLSGSYRGQLSALPSLQAAQEYLAHPLLGARLRECCQAVMDVEGKSAHDIFGSPDDVKFRSCLTLFAQAAPDETLFTALLVKYFDGKADELTLQKLH